MQSRLLRCLANALAKNGVKFLCGLVPGGDVLFDIASDAWQAYRESGQNSLRAEIQTLAQSPAEQVRQASEQAAQAAGAHLSTDARRKIATYLGQVPPMIRRSLRSPSDPTGTTVPADLPLRSPEDLLPFLPPNPPRFQQGMRPLAGVDWVLEEPLGVGGFGEVWKARHAHLKSKPPVALKFCLDPAAAAVLRNEAGVLDRLMRHGPRQGVVPLLDAYLSADPPCLVYEYVEGGDLTNVIRALHAKGPQPAAAVNRILLRLAEIVASAHRADPPIVHDDLKPSNVLVRRVPDGLRLFVTDYGIGGLAVARAMREGSRPTRSRELLLTEAVRGAYTPLYASPQQMARRRGEPPDPRDDVHALGVIWYQMLTGDLTMVRVPADWTDEVRARGLPDKQLELLGACLASRAEKRPPSAGILAGELRAPEPAGPKSSSTASGGRVKQRTKPVDKSGDYKAGAPGRTKRMKRLPLWLWLGGGVVVLFMVFLSFGGVSVLDWCFASGPRITKANYDKITMGASEKEVTDIMGPPNTPSEDGEKAAWTPPLRMLVASERALALWQAEEMKKAGTPPLPPGFKGLIWKNGDDSIQVFLSKDKVVYKAYRIGAESGQQGQDPRAPQKDPAPEAAR